MNSITNTNTLSDKIIVSTFDKTFILDTKDIIHCEALNNYTRIYLKNNEDILVAKSLGNYENLLIKKGNFIRIHRSHIININHIKSLSKGDKGEINLDNGQRIPYSPEKKKILLNMFTVYKS